MKTAVFYLSLLTASAAFGGWAVKQFAPRQIVPYCKCGCHLTIIDCDGGPNGMCPPDANAKPKGPQMCHSKKAK